MRAGATVGLHQATAPEVGAAWEQFFAACWSAYEHLQQRRAEKGTRSEVVGESLQKVKPTEKCA